MTGRTECPLVPVNQRGHPWLVARGLHADLCPCAPSASTIPDLSRLPSTRPMGCSSARGVSSWSALRDERAGHPRAGLLGFARVVGGRDRSARPATHRARVRSQPARHPGAGAPPPEAAIPVGGRLARGQLDLCGRIPARLAGHVPDRLSRTEVVE
jgi:hypothetical protein